MRSRAVAIRIGVRLPRALGPQQIEARPVRQTEIKHRGGIVGGRNAAAASATVAT
ncbi:hypothetical protein HNP73_000676 [Amaricoccus macauensis]|uniref:Uncharacterized protein n=1 Tax=Amaricoccus macauensis TaxID=57001 RepID=A0A840SJC4_9RHOB|nr:hypothetical protein [Amaricoccus macauensis]MBB5220755.1 hypothetical protein [Amaricoccus macauensis]